MVALLLTDYSSLILKANATEVLVDQYIIPSLCSANVIYVLTSASATRLHTVTDTHWSSVTKFLSVILEDYHKVKQVFAIIMIVNSQIVNLFKLLRDLKQYEQL